MSQETVQRALEKPKPKLTFSDKLSSFSFRLFSKEATRVSHTLPSLRDELLKSNIRMTPEALVSVALFWTLLSFFVSAIGAIMVLVSGMLIFTSLLFVPPIVFLLILKAPKVSQSLRAYALDNELHFVIGYMAILAGGGVSPVSTLRKFANMGSIFPAASKEARRILIDIDFFGMDPTSALAKAAKYSPNKAFSEFLYGYTSVLKTGGDFVTYLDTKLKDIFDGRSAKIKKSSETIGMLAEAYVTITSLLGISLFITYQVQAILTNSPEGIQNLLFFSFLVVPILSAVFIWVIDSVQPKQPHADYRPYKIFLASLPAGTLLYVLPLPINMFLHVALVLVAIVVAPSFLAFRYSRGNIALERNLPEFVRDMAEGRRIGLAPEGNIELLAERNYGRLSKHITRMGAQLSWGVSLRKVAATFTKEVNSWVAKVIATLMLEVVDAGGGTVKSFTDMAEFTRKVNNIEAEKRSALAPYIFVTYFAGILITVTTFLMVFLLSQANIMAAKVPGFATTITPDTVDLLFVAAIIQGWIVGIVSGKMGEGRVYDGFKHALALVIINMMAIYISKLFISIPL